MSLFKAAYAKDKRDKLGKKLLKLLGFFVCIFKQQFNIVISC